MKQYECDLCGYIYDEAAGDPDNGIAPGTKWEDLPADWVCPLCGAGKDEFTAKEKCESRARGSRDFFFEQGRYQTREGAIRLFRAGTLGRTCSSREPRMKQAAASPMPTVRALKP